MGLLADLQEHSRGNVVSLGVVGATERLSAIVCTLSTRKTGHGVHSGGPAQRLVAARAAALYLVDNARTLRLSAQLLLVLARAAHAFSAAERVLLPGSWEAN